MKPTKHFIDRMIERNITAEMVSEVLKSHILKPGNSDQEIKIVGSKVTLVASKSKNLLTCYFN